MEPVVLSVIVSLVLYLIAVAVIPSSVLNRSSAYTRHMLGRLRQQNLTRQGAQELYAIVDDPSDNPLVRGFLLVPGMQRFVPLIQRADEWKRLDKFVLGFLLVFLVLLFVFARFGLFGLVLAAGGTYVLAWLYLLYRLSRRRKEFITQFPEALDAIVRSVRSGYPLHTAVTLVGENLPPPMGVEFRRVADETAYGYSLMEALVRMADRIDLPDVRFFTVVLAVQQESGGSLAEVLGNLSTVIRKRKHMRDKIKALSSEGRATAWVLFALPFIVFGAVLYLTPDHFTPLLYTTSGHIVIASVACMMGIGMMVVRQIVNMEV